MSSCIIWSFLVDIHRWKNLCSQYNGSDDVSLAANYLEQPGLSALFNGYLKDGKTKKLIALCMHPDAIEIASNILDL